MGHFSNCPAYSDTQVWATLCSDSQWYPLGRPPHFSDSRAFLIGGGAGVSVDSTEAELRDLIYLFSCCAQQVVVQNSLGSSSQGKRGLVRRVTCRFKRTRSKRCGAQLFGAGYRHFSAHRSSMTEG